MEGSGTAGSGFDVVTALAPLRRSLGVAQAVRLVLLGAGAGALAGAGVLALGHLLTVPSVRILALLLPPVGVVFGLGRAIQQWPDTIAAARSADRHFSLQDRLTTALFLHADAAPLAGLQRADTADRVSTLTLRDGRERVHVGRESVAALLALVLFAVLLVPGTSGRQTTRASAADAKRIRSAAVVRLPSVARTVNAGLTPQQRQSPAIRKLNLALASLRRQLMQTATRRGALRAISATQAKLHNLAASLHPVSPKAAAQLARGLGLHASRRSSQSAQRANLAATAKAVDALASALKHMTAAQRATLARKLASTANATSDSRMRAALHQAASSLAYQDPAAAAAALKQAAAALAGSTSAQAAQAKIDSASGRLSGLKASVAGLTHVAGGQSPTGGSAKGSAASGAHGKGQGNGQGSAGGKGAGQGNGKSNGQGRGNGKGSGQGRGSGKGQGSGQGQGNGHGQGQGSGSGGGGGTGGHGSGGGRGGSGPKAQGRFSTVYVPFHQGKGTHSIQSGPAGAPQGGAMVPYRQVVQQYTDEARNALDRSQLPPAAQSYVRRYFSTISH